MSVAQLSIQALSRMIGLLRAVLIDGHAHIQVESAGIQSTRVDLFILLILELEFHLVGLHPGGRVDGLAFLGAVHSKGIAAVGAAICNDDRIIVGGNDPGAIVDRQVFAQHNGINRHARSIILGLRIGTIRLESLKFKGVLRLIQISIVNFGKAPDVVVIHGLRGIDGKAAHVRGRDAVGEIDFNRIGVGNNEIEG